MQTLNARRSWKDTFQSIKDCQPILAYPTKLFFLIEGEMKTFYNKQKLKEFRTTKPSLQKILKESCTHQKLNSPRKMQEKINPNDQVD
jgi:hypothetical protein